GNVPAARPRDRDVVVDRRIAIDAVSRDTGRRAAGGGTGGDNRARTTTGTGPRRCRGDTGGYGGGGIADSAGRVVGQRGFVRDPRLLRDQPGGNRRARRCQPRDLVPVLQLHGQDPYRDD